MVCTEVVSASRGCVHLAQASQQPPWNKPATDLSSLLVVVTGIWNDFRHADLYYLDTILRNYVMACEAGFRVSVVLSTYHTPKDKKDWEAVMDFERYFCERVDAPLPISVERFENRGLPPGAFGTAGDLAIRHREIFLRERTNFDLFLVQEDDVDIQPRALLYALRWLRRFQNAKTAFWPVFIDTEVASLPADPVSHASPYPHAHRITSYRANFLEIFKFDNITLARVLEGGASGRSYMITSQMLSRVNATEWVDPRSFKGEFNPEVASSGVLEKLGKVMVVPLEDGEWLGSLVTHLPNKYTKMMPAEARNATPETFAPDHFTPLRVEELKAAIDSCLQPRHNSMLLLDHKGPSCFEHLHGINGRDPSRQKVVNLRVEPDRGLDRPHRKIRIVF